MSAVNPHALVDTAWLAEHLTDPSVRVVEIDEDIAAYDKGHIPGAVAWSWFADLHHPVRRDYLGQTELSELLSRSGVGPDTTLVVYGGNNNWFAAYGFWLLTYRGFDNVRLLDGGRSTWEAEGRPFTTDIPTYAPTGLRITTAERPHLRVLRDDVIGAVGTSSFVDVRSPQEYTGEKLAPEWLPQEQPYVGGHIPGARNIPWGKAANADGTFKSPEELAALYSAEGITPGGEIITYCRIGERAAHTWFVLTQLLGYDNVKNYDGSWTEYGSLVGVPVER